MKCASAQRSTHSDVGGPFSSYLITVKKKLINSRCAYALRPRERANQTQLIQIAADDRVDQVLMHRHSMVSVAVLHVSRIGPADRYAGGRRPTRVCFCKRVTRAKW